MAKNPFELALTRVDGLLDLHEQVQGGKVGRPKQHTSDLLRGALVLTMAALDAVVLDSVIAAIPVLARQDRLGPNPAKWVKEHQRPIDLVVARNPIEALVECCRSNLSAVTFQRAKMIEGVLQDTLGCGPPWEQAAQTLSTSKAPWNEQDVVDHLDQYVDRRNRIAHDGDRVASGKANSIRRDYVENALWVADAVGHAVQHVIREHVSTAK